MAKQPEKKSWQSKPLIIQMRGSLEFKEWTEALARFDRNASLADLVERALVEYARNRRFDREAPER